MDKNNYNWIFFLDNNFIYDKFISFPKFTKLSQYNLFLRQELPKIFQMKLMKIGFK